MTSRSTEALTGGLVLATAIGFGVYAAQARDFSAGSGAMLLTASFRSVEGISTGSDVRLAGVKVGTVTDLTLNPETFRAEVKVSVQDEIKLPDDSAIVISQEGLLGGNFVEIVPGGSPFNLEPGAEIMDTQGAVSLTSLLMKFVSSSGDSE